MSFENNSAPKSKENETARESALVAAAALAAIVPVELATLANQGLDDQDAAAYAMPGPLNTQGGLSSSIDSAVAEFRKNPEQPLIIKIPAAEMAEAKMHVDIAEAAHTDQVHIDLDENPIHINGIES